MVLSKIKIELLPLISEIQKICQKRYPSVVERANKFLQEANFIKHEIGDTFEFECEELKWRFALASYSINCNKKRFSERNSEVDYLFGYLEKSGFIAVDYRRHARLFQITPEGYAKIEENPIISNNGFVAMSFSSNMDEAYAEGFKKAIEDSGYDPVRVDKQEHTQKNR